MRPPSIPAWMPNAKLSRFVFSRPHLWHFQQGGAGPTVLLLHGAGASVHSWRALIPDLIQDHQVVALDLPGQGLSELGDRRRCSLHAMTEDIEALLVQEALFPDMVVGHSAGGAIAFQLVVNGRIKPRAIVTINAALADFAGDAGVVFPMLAKLLTMNPITPLALSVAGSNASLVRRTIEGTGSQIDDAGLEGYRSLFSSRAHVSATMKMMASWDLKPLRDQLSQVTLPSLFLVGDADLAVPPASSLDIAKQMPSSHVEHYPAAGHLLHEEQPDEIAGQIRSWLAAHSAPHVEET